MYYIIVLKYFNINNVHLSAHTGALALIQPITASFPCSLPQFGSPIGWDLWYIRPFCHWLGLGCRGDHHGTPHSWRERTYNTGVSLPAKMLPRPPQLRDTIFCLQAVLMLCFINLPSRHIQVNAATSLVHKNEWPTLDQWNGRINSYVPNGKVHETHK